MAPRIRGAGRGHGGRKYALVAALALAVAASSAGCSTQKRAGAEATTSAPHARPTTTTARRSTGPIAPLSGLPDRSGASAHRRALTVKVENTPQARPQFGLEQADVVYEEVVEGGITRLLAIFQSQVPAEVGPIRSVRRTDQSVVTPIGGIFAYSGGAPYAIASIRTAPVTLVDETRAGNAMFRDHNRAAPHNLYGRPALLFAIGGAPVPPPPLFAYRHGNAPIGGHPVTSVHVGFGAGYAVDYRWNATAHTWARSIFGRPDVAASGTQQAPRNVVVLLVQYAGGAGVEGAEADLMGAGDAIVFTGGREIPARWLRPDRAKPARLVNAAGHTVGLAPGQTWVELAPAGTLVTAS